MTRLRQFLSRIRLYLWLVRESALIERVGAFRIEYRVGRQRRVLSRWSDPFAKEEALRPFVESLRARGAEGDVVLALATSGVVIVRWPLAAGAGPEWPFEGAPAEPGGRPED